jgi:hypothetical protein
MTSDWVWCWPPTASCLVRAVYDWQTIIAGGIALAAAIVAATMVHRQNRVAWAIENRRLMARHRAALAVLPLKLSEICAHATSQAHELIAYSQASDRTKPPRLKVVVPDPALTASLERVIEACVDDEAADLLAHIIAEMQFLHARVENSSARGHHDVAWSLVNTLTIYTAAGTLFEYARRWQCGPSILGWEQVRTCSLAETFDPANYLETMAIIDKLEELGCRVLETMLPSPLAGS